MTLQDFLNDFNRQLKEYGEKMAAERMAAQNKEQTHPDFFKYMAAYMTEGSPANMAIKQATKIVLTDEIFVNRLASCVEYIIAMTMAAALSNSNREDDE